jgi:hypothetical protein
LREAADKTKDKTRDARAGAHLRKLLAGGDRFVLGQRRHVFGLNTFSDCPTGPRSEHCPTASVCV